MKTPNPDQPIRNTLKQLALALTMGVALYFGAAPASAAPPVTTGLKLHLDASQLIGLSDGDTVTIWTDMSGLGNNANLSSGTPTYETGVLNGQPVVRFDGNSRLTAADLSAHFPTAASVFAVITPNNDNMYSAFGDRDNDERWMGGNWSEVTPGAFRGGRADFSSSYSLMPSTGSHIFVNESSASAYNFLLNGSLIGTAAADYNSGTITVTLRNSSSTPIANKVVSLAQTTGSGATITTVTGTTGSDGKAVFTVTSATVGAAVFTATDILKGVGEETLESRFMVHSIGPVLSVDGIEPPPLEAVSIKSAHADLLHTGGFSCSNPFLNHVHDAITGPRRK